ncbi:MAG: hypothetical protein ACR2KQ_03750 [Actinomycetota bacterium]
MKHDPERSAAAYLAGVMGRRARVAFERHILRCEDCWSEVFTARRGRSVAESAREIAPQHLREMVRSTVASVPPHRRRFPRWFVATIMLLPLLGGGAVLLGAFQEEQPRPIAATVADYQAIETLEPTVRSTLPQRLGDLELQEVRAGDAEGVPVIVHHYADAAGHQVAVYQSNVPFPDAAGARHSNDGRTWTALVDGTHVFCSDDPVPSLVLGNNPDEVRVAVEELGLR